jgi:hypothetical protein
MIRSVLIFYNLIRKFSCGRAGMFALVTIVEGLVSECPRGTGV